MTTETLYRRLVDTEPRVRDYLPTFSRQANERIILHEWQVSEDQYVVLSVTYRKGGPNYYTGSIDPANRYVASLRREKAEPSGGRSFMAFTGYITHKSEDIARYSAKRHRAFAVEAVERLRDIADNPEIARFFDPGRDPNAEGMP